MRARSPRPTPGAAILQAASNPHPRGQELPPRWMSTAEAREHIRRNVKAHRKRSLGFSITVDTFGGAFAQEIARQLASRSGIRLVASSAVLLGNPWIGIPMDLLMPSSIGTSSELDIDLSTGLDTFGLVAPMAGMLEHPDAALTTQRQRLAQRFSLLADGPSQAIEWQSRYYLTQNFRFEPISVAAGGGPAPSSPGGSSRGEHVGRGGRGDVGGARGGDGGSLGVGRGIDVLTGGF